MEAKPIQTTTHAFFSRPTSTLLPRKVVALLSATSSELAEPDLLTTKGNEGKGKEGTIHIIMKNLKNQVT